jgi:hypothetical protein
MTFENAVSCLKGSEKSFIALYFFSMSANLFASAGA